MKSLKNLNSQSNRQINISYLASIEKQKQINTRKQKVSVPCAFHSNQMITNFCKNVGCLLPLCPKCVKIHIDQHSELGNFARFQVIQDCLDQAHQSIINVFAQANKMQNMSLRIEQSHARKVILPLKQKEQSIQQLQKAKLIILQKVSQFFKYYQQSLFMELQKQDRKFTEKLIQYHSLMSQVMQNCRNSSKKFSNKSTIMEGLISFYSKSDYPILLKQCQQKLNKITDTKIQVITYDLELNRLQQLLRKYVRFGDNITSMQKIAGQNKANYNLAQQGVRGHFDGQAQPFGNKERSASRYRNSHRNQFDQFNFGSLQNMKTPLDTFSLQRSRNTRVCLEQKQTKQY